MRRTYTRERYLDRVALIREHVPDVALTTDIIVGFPGETEADFAETLEVVEEVGYDGAFTFIFSPAPRDRGRRRSTTRSPHEVKVERMERLVEVVQRRARERAQRFVGRTLEVLVEGTSRTDPSRLRGRTRHNKVVNFAGLAQPGELRRRRDRRRHEPDAPRRAGQPARAQPLIAPSAPYANIRSCAGTGTRWRRTSGPAPRPRRPRGRPPVRRARGARHPILRGPQQKSRSTASPRDRASLSNGRSTRIEVALMLVFTVSWATRRCCAPTAGPSRFEVFAQVSDLRHRTARQLSPVRPHRGP